MKFGDKYDLERNEKKSLSKVINYVLKKCVNFITPFLTFVIMIQKVVGFGSR